jgi:hypothetical protein
MLINVQPYRCPGERNCKIETAVWIYVGNTSLLP